jgi:hypothetical protein
MTLGFYSDSADFEELDRQRRALWIAVAAGFFAALASAVLICRTPYADTPQFVLVVLAGTYLGLVALFGVSSSFLVWWRSCARSAPGLLELLQSTAAGWVWIPAVVLLFRENSSMVPMVAAAGAATLAISLRRGGPAVLAEDEDPLAAEWQPQELFARSLAQAATDWRGPVIAGCLCGVAVSLAWGWLFPGCALLAVAAFAFAWSRWQGSHAATPSGVRSLGTLTLRQSRSALPALIVTVLAMIAGAGHDIQALGLGWGSSTPVNAQPTVVRPGMGQGGHVSIVLLTAPQTFEVQSPRTKNPLAPTAHLTKPMVIPFDGEYWYFQPPESTPGPGAYVAHGSPLSAAIHSTMSIPLMMQAHQHLSMPMQLDCCSEIDVEIENRDQTLGALDLGVSLSDSKVRGKMLPLGVKPIASSLDNGPGNAPGTGAGSGLGQASPGTRETLRFAIPAQTGKGQRRIRSFDQIDFVIVPNRSMMQNGARVAIRSMELKP